MKKFKGYYYSTFKTDIASRNCFAAIQYYGWNICNYNSNTKKYDVLESSTENYLSKADAAQGAIDHINEYHY